MFSVLSFRLTPRTRRKPGQPLFILKRTPNHAGPLPCPLYLFLFGRTGAHTSSPPSISDDSQDFVFSSIPPTGVFTPVVASSGLTYYGVSTNLTSGVCLVQCDGAVSGLSSTYYLCQKISAVFYLEGEFTNTTDIGIAITIETLGSNLTSSQSLTRSDVSNAQTNTAYQSPNSTVYRYSNPGQLLSINGGAYQLYPQGLTYLADPNTDFELSSTGMTPPRLRSHSIQVFPSVCPQDHPSMLPK